MKSIKTIGKVLALTLLVSPICVMGSDMGSEAPKTRVHDSVKKSVSLKARKNLFNEVVKVGAKCKKIGFDYANKVLSLVKKYPIESGFLGVLSIAAVVIGPTALLKKMVDYSKNYHPLYPFGYPPYNPKYPYMLLR